MPRLCSKAVEKGQSISNQPNGSFNLFQICYSNNKTKNLTRENRQTNISNDAEIVYPTPFELCMRLAAE